MARTSYINKLPGTRLARFSDCRRAALSQAPRFGSSRFWLHERYFGSGVQSLSSLIYWTSHAVLTWKRSPVGSRFLLRGVGRHATSHVDILCLAPQSREVLLEAM